MGLYRAFGPKNQTENKAAPLAACNKETEGTSKRAVQKPDWDKHRDAVRVNVTSTFLDPQIHSRSREWLPQKRKDGPGSQWIKTKDYFFVVAICCKVMQSASGPQKVTNVTTQGPPLLSVTFRSHVSRMTSCGFTHRRIRSNCSFKFPAQHDNDVHPPFEIWSDRPFLVCRLDFLDCPRCFLKTQWLKQLLEQTPFSFVACRNGPGKSFQQDFFAHVSKTWRWRWLVCMNWVGSPLRNQDSPLSSLALESIPMFQTSVRRYTLVLPLLPSWTVCYGGNIQGKTCFSWLILCSSCTRRLVWTSPCPFTVKQTLVPCFLRSEIEQVSWLRYLSMEEGWQIFGVSVKCFHPTVPGLDGNTTFFRELYMCVCVPRLVSGSVGV